MMAATGSVFNSDVWRTGIASAFHTSACLRARGEGDARMILSAAFSISEEYWAKRDWFRELSSGTDASTVLARLIEEVFFVVRAPQPQRNSSSPSARQSNPWTLEPAFLTVRRLCDMVLI